MGDGHIYSHGCGMFIKYSRNSLAKLTNSALYILHYQTNSSIYLTIETFDKQQIQIQINID